jgi:UDPglucose 6-dehydrogenase
MKVQIIGMGVVGKAQAYLFSKLGHEVYGFDINHETSEFAKKLEEPVHADITFICTPEAVVEEVIQSLLARQVQGLYVIKSTVPVGTTEKLMEKYGIHICHNPEFLREKSPYEDVLKPDRIIIGQCCSQHGNLLAQLYSPLSAPIYLTTPRVSELAKLVSNAYLSTLITFWNEVFLLTEKLKVDVREVAELVCSDHRMSRYGTSKFGEPFNGRCLPKDLEQLINTFHQKGLTPILFSAVKRFNEELKK